MQLSLPIIALPAFVALIVKAGVFAYTRMSAVKSSPEARFFLLFLLVLAVQNSVEIYVLYTLNTTNTVPALASTVLMNCYFPIVALFFCLAVNLALSAHPRLMMMLTQAAYLWVLIMMVLLYNGLIVRKWGVLDYGFGKTIDVSSLGPFAAVYELSAPIILIAGLGIAIFGAYTQTTERRRAKNRVLIIGFVPTALVGIANIVFVYLGVKWFNATVTTPITLTYFLLTIAYATYHSRFLEPELSMENLRKSRMALADAWNEIQNLRKNLNKSNASITSLREANQRLRDLAQESANAANIAGVDSHTAEVDIASSGKTLDEHIAEIERRLIKQALAQSHGNQSQAARLLGLRRNTLHYKLERYGLLTDE